MTGVDNGTGAALLRERHARRGGGRRWSYKLSAGYFTQDPLPRPTGTIPNAFNTPYPPYTNTGTSQPKFDARVDYELANRRRLVFSGGVAGTEGIIHSGIGPFDIDSGSRLTYFSGRYQKGGRRVAFFTNLLNGDADEPAVARRVGRVSPAGVRHQDVRHRGRRRPRLGTRHVLSFGGNFRHNTFDISIAPNGDDRNEGGAYIQDEIFLSDQFRWVVGGRLDKFSSIDNAVFSPRTTLMYKPAPNQTFRAVVQPRVPRAVVHQQQPRCRAPQPGELSAIIPALSAFVFPFRAVGNPDLSRRR